MDRQIRHKIIAIYIEKKIHSGYNSFNIAFISVGIIDGTKDINSKNVLLKVVKKIVLNIRN